MSLALTHSRCQDGIHALPVSVESHLSGGLPAFAIVGLPETAVRESRERVRSALLNSGFEFPNRRITVNLAPADIRKDGTRFDLAIALGILAASGQAPAAPLEGCEFLAELALDGTLRPVGAALPAALAARDAGRDLVVCGADAHEAALVRGARIRVAASLGEVCRHAAGDAPLPCIEGAPPPAPAGDQPDLGDVVGQFRARRALEIAAAGEHNLLLIGPPGTGKTMLASRLPGLLPPLSEAQALESASVHAAAGVPIDAARWGLRPFRAPHHGCSSAAIVGGGRTPRPGEISLAHHGVLFLDELPEFERRALEALREPLESGAVTVARAARVARFPARFLLVAAMNPCPCGFDGDEKIPCRCTGERVERYRSRISGPLSERIDLHVEVPRQPAGDFSNANAPGESSRDVRDRVSAVRARQIERQGTPNGRLDLRGVQRECTLSPDARRLLRMIAERLALSARGCHKVLKLARTIADMEDEACIGEAHVAEAAGFRTLDRARTSS